MSKRPVMKSVLRGMLESCKSLRVPFLPFFRNGRKCLRPKSPFVRNDRLRDKRNLRIGSTFLGDGRWAHYIIRYYRQASRKSPLWWLKLGLSPLTAALVCRVSRSYRLGLSLHLLVSAEALRVQARKGRSGLTYHPLYILSSVTREAGWLQRELWRFGV